MNKLVAGMVFAAALSASARTLTWTGGDSGSVDSSANWTDVDGQTNAAPVNCDRLIFSKGGTFTKNDSYLTLMGMQVTADAPVTLTGGKYDFETGCDGLSVTGSGEVTLDSAVNMGYSSADFKIFVDTGATLNVNGRLTGPGKPVYKGGGTVNLNSTTSDYTGSTLIYNGLINVNAEKAFGATNGATTVYYSDAAYQNTLKVTFNGVTTDENFTLDTYMRTEKATTTSVYFPADTVTTFNGSVNFSDAVYHTVGSGAKVIFNGSCIIRNPSYAFTAPAEVVYNGAGSQLSADYCGGSGIVRYRTPITVTGSDLWVRIPNASACRFLECENAMGAGNAYASWVAAGTMDICGFDQTFWYLSASENCKNGKLTSSGENPVTVHLALGTAVNAMSCSFYGKVTGPISISCEGPKPFKMMGVSTSDGSFSLTNQANVTFGVGSAWAGKRLSVAGGSTLTLEDVSFPEDVMVEIADDPDDTLPKSRLVLLANQKIGSFVLNGEPVEQGKTIGSVASGADIQDDEHFGGAGQIAVGEAQLDPTEATWTDGGADNLFSTAENWSIAPKRPNFDNGLVTLTFAEAGDDAQLDRDVTLKGVKFSGRDFALTAAPDASMTVKAGGIAVADAGDGLSHVMSVNAPVVMDNETFTVEVGGANNTLRLSQAMTGAVGRASVPFTKRGLGTLYTDAVNLTPGTRTQYNGKWYATAQSLGPSNTQVNIRQTDGPTVFYLNGGTFEQKFSIERGTAATYTFAAVANTTNLLTQPFSYNDSWGIDFQLNAGSQTRFMGGFAKTGSWAGMFQMGDGAEMTVEGGPFAYNESSLLARFYTTSTTGRARLEFAAPGGYARMGLAIGGPIDVHFTADGAFSTNTYRTALCLRNLSGGGHPKLHLHGTTQYFGRASSDDINGFSNWQFPDDKTGAEITSEAGGMLCLCQTGKDAVWYAYFTGSASLEKSGDKTLTLAVASPSTGTLAVSAGTLDFAADVPEAGWTNCSAVAVSGGTLKVDRKGRLAKGAAYTLTGGTLEVAAGVRLKGSSLTLPDGSGGTRTETVGVFTSANCPYISGEGELVLQTGTMILVK